MRINIYLIISLWILTLLPLQAQETAFYSDSIASLLARQRPFGAEQLAKEWLQNTSNPIEKGKAQYLLAQTLSNRTQWDYHKIQEHYLKAIEWLSKEEGQEPLLAKARLGFLQAAFLQRDDDLKQPDFNAIIQYGGPPQPFQLDALYLKMLYAFKFQGVHEAKKSLAPFKAIQRRFMDYQPAYKDVIYAHLALDVDEWEKATNHLLRAEENMLVPNPLLIVPIGTLYLKMAEKFAANENYLMAADYAHRALLVSSVGFETPEDLAPNPEVHQLLELPLALEALLLKSKWIAQLDSTGQASRAAAALAAQVTGHLQNHNQSPEKLQKWWQLCDQAYQQAVSGSFGFYELQQDPQILEEVFYFMERRKALWLWYLQQRQGPPLNKLEQEEAELSRQTWYFQLATYQAQLNEQKDLFAHNERQLEKVNAQRDRLVEKLLKEHPATMTTKYATDLPEVPEIQEQLGEKDLFWYYLIGNENVYVLEITATQLYLHQRRAAVGSGESLKQTSSLSNASLASLFVPDLKFEPAHLIVIPEGDLFSQPLGGLFDASVDKLPPLSYQFSATQWLKLLQKQPHPVNYSLLAYSKSDESPVLDYLEGRFGALCYKGEGRWSDFKGQLPYYGFLYLEHLDSNLLDSVLYVALAWEEMSEGGDAQNEAALWKLYLQIEQGVDAIVLPQGVLTTEARREWIELFYEHLQDGLSKDAALQQAFFDYQQAHPSSEGEESLSAYRLYGDYRSVRLSEPISYIWWYLIPIVALLGLGWWTVRGLRQRRKF